MNSQNTGFCEFCHLLFEKCFYLNIYLTSVLKMTHPELPIEIVSMIRKDATDISVYANWKQQHDFAFTRTKNFIINQGHVIHNRLNHFGNVNPHSTVKCEILNFVERTLNEHGYDSGLKYHTYIMNGMTRILTRNGYNVSFN